METRYPRNVNVNFKLLDKEALEKVAKYYSLKATETTTHSELATAIAKKFEKQGVETLELENDILDKFAFKYCKASAEPFKGRKRNCSTREILDTEAARPGEQVAAKVLKTNENGSWILGNILDFNGIMYEVQDEDDASRRITLGLNEVRRLEDTAAHLRRGDNVLAVFPETTSFYRATVVKNPKNPTSSNGIWEVVVRFDDDEDETGKAPPRRVPARFVLRRDDAFDEDEEEGEE